MTEDREKLGRTRSALLVLAPSIGGDRFSWIFPFAFGCYDSQEK